MKKPLNEYRVRVVKQVVGETYIEANSLQEAELVADRMDSNDIRWDDEEWPELDVELVREGKHSVLQTIPLVLHYLYDRAQSDAGTLDEKEMHKAAQEAWVAFVNTPAAYDMLKAQLEQYGPFAPKEDA